MENAPAVQTVSALGLGKTYSAMVSKYHASMGPLTLEGVTAYLAELGKTARPSTVRVMKYALQGAILAQCPTVAEQEMIRAAFRKVRTPKPMRAINQKTLLTVEQVKALSVADASPRARLLVRVLSATGTRLSEALGMKKADCTIDGDVVTVRVMGKGRKERMVFLPLSLYGEVLAVFGGSVFLFETSGGLPLHPVNARRMVYSVARAAGMKNVHPHSLRHAFASNQLRAGRTLKAVSKYLGHSSTSITADYYDLNVLSASEALGVA